MLVRTRTVHCTQVLADQPRSIAGGWACERGGRDQSLHHLLGTRSIAPRLPYPTQQYLAARILTDVAQVDSVDMACLPGLARTPLARQLPFPQACRPSLAAHVKQHVQSPSSAASSHQQSSTTRFLQSCLSAQLLRLTACPLGSFSSVQQMRQCHFEARTTKNQRRENTRHALTSDVTKSEDPGASSNFVI